MDDNQFWDELTGIFRSVFNVEDLTISAETTAADVAAWDSLSHIQLILGIESHFGIHFTSGEVASFDNVGDLMTAIKRHKKA